MTSFWGILNKKAEICLTLIDVQYSVLLAPIAMLSNLPYMQIEVFDTKHA